MKEKALDITDTIKLSKMKKIVIAIDDDPTAQAVAEAGFNIAKAMSAGVVLVHVLSDIQDYALTAASPISGFGGYMDMSYSEPVIEALTRQASFRFIDEITAKHGDTRIETIVKEGDVASVLLQAAAEEDAGMIVIGSHSRKWLEAILMGSVTEKVLRHTVIPLFIVPTKKNE
jgi:nucleotide-binding universal stress UspA family protein